MEHLSDSEILERLIYKAFVAPDEFLPRNTGDALLTFSMAMRLYSKIKSRESSTEVKLQMTGLINDGQAPDIDDADTDEAEETPPPPPSPDQIRGYCAEEKKDILAELQDFCAARGLGAKKKIADASGGKLTMMDVLDLLGCKNKPISAWRAARDAMERIVESENGG